VWAFLAAICSAIAIGQFRVSVWALGVLLVPILLIHIWWVYQNWIRNREDSEIAFDYFEEVHGLVSTRPPPERKRQAPRWIVQDAVPTCEIGIGIVLSVAALYLTPTVR